MNFLKKIEDSTDWLSYSDLMSALMMVFLFISISFMFEAQKLAPENAERATQAIKKSEQVLRKLKKQRGLIALSIEKEFKQDFKKIGAHFDAEKLSITFKPRYRHNQDNPPEDLKVILREFMPKLVSRLSRIDQNGLITGISFDGHTDKSGDFNYNLGLSFRRAFGALFFLLNQPEIFNSNEEYLWFKSKVSAKGYSSNTPVKRRGKIDWRRSKRIEIRIKTNRDKALNDIKDAIGGVTL